MVKHSATDTLLAAPGENRVALRGMDWVAYCQMRSLLNERTRARLTYDRGTLEDREDLDRGAEPDNGYYIQNQPQVAGRAISLSVDVSVLGRLQF